MPLTISTSVDPLGPASIDTPSAIAALATSTGNPPPPGATAVGVTVPVIRTDQTGLNYHTRNAGTEFRFNTGTLELTLRQEIHLSNALNLCARGIWLRHEEEHVFDNEEILDEMATEIRADPEIRRILVSPTRWLPRADFQRTQDTIQNRIATIFQRLTGEAARHRDTRREYENVDRQVRIRCGRTLAPGNLSQGMHGKGIDIVQNALNNSQPTRLAPLTVDGVFGPMTDARVREFQANQQPPLTDDGIVGPKTKAALGLQ